MTFEDSFPLLVDEATLTYRGTSGGVRFIQNVFLDETISKHCLDKQRVREAVLLMSSLMAFKKERDDFDYGEHLSVVIDGKSPAEWLFEELSL